MKVKVRGQGKVKERITMMVKKDNEGEEVKNKKVKKDN